MLFGCANGSLLGEWRAVSWNSSPYSLDETISWNSSPLSAVTTYPGIPHHSPHGRHPLEILTILEQLTLVCVSGRLSVIKKVATWHPCCVGV
ncbi:hypothetical protein B0G69_3829 [Paraburkholderia sp. RAU2J]|nr:hypothetical protein B0G69_3829 [Paraburkholderia sp. RAU2J]